jgi:hypothetical protein
VSLARVLRCDKCRTMIALDIIVRPSLAAMRAAAYPHGWRVVQGSRGRRLFDLCPVCSLTWRGEEKALVAEMEGKP